MTAITGRGLQIPQSLAEMLAPRTTALIVYDMQVGVLGQIADADCVIRQVRRLLDGARAAGLRILFTRHMSLPPALMGVMQYRTAMAWQRVDDPDQVRPWFLPDSTGFQLVPALAPTADEAVLDKLAMSAFEGTPLSLILRDCGVTTVLFCGVATEVGIEPSLRHAADLGFIPILAADACGAGHAEAAARSLEALRFSGDAVISDVDSILAAFG